MSTRTDTYSTAVSLLKIALPLVALLILSTVFLLARKPDATGVLPLADDKRLFAEQAGLSRPSFAGVTTSGSAITVVARTVRPDPQDPKSISADGLQAILEKTDEGRISIAAQIGVLHLGDRTAELLGGVALESSNGYLVQTTSLGISLDTGRIETYGSVGAETPAGTLTAGSMVYEAGPDQRHLLVFKDGVRLVYEPEPPR